MIGKKLNINSDYWDIPLSAQDSKKTIQESLDEFNAEYTFIECDDGFSGGGCEEEEPE